MLDTDAFILEEEGRGNFIGSLRCGVSVRVLHSAHKMKVCVNFALGILAQGGVGVSLEIAALSSGGLDMEISVYHS